MARIIGAIGIGAGVSLPAYGAPYEEHTVGNSWQWFTDYVYSTSDWTFAAVPQCSIEVATGVMAFGHPLGSTYRIAGYQTLTAYGAGAIHVRAVNKGTTCLVRMYMGTVSAVTIYGQPSVASAALETANSAAKRIADEHKKASENEISAPSK